MTKATEKSDDVTNIPWSEVAPEIRKDHLGTIFVDREETKRVFAAIDSARADRLRYPEARNVVIVGDTGVGKSEIAKRYLAANPESIDPETGNVVRPVFYMDVRNSSTPKAVATAAMRHLLRRGDIDDINDPDPTDLSQEDEDREKERYASIGVPDLTHAVKRQMVGQKVEVAFMDEFHNTVTDNGAVRLNRIAEWVKDFAKSKNRTGRRPNGRPEENIVFVLIGLKKKINAIINPAVNKELASITPYRIEIGRYRYNTARERHEFRQFLADLDAELPFDEDSELGEPAIANKMHIVSFGLLRQVGQIVTKAGEIAIDEGSPRILEHHLYLSVEMQRGILEAPLMSDDNTGGNRSAVKNPFKAPVLPVTEKVRKRSGYKG